MASRKRALLAPTDDWQQLQFQLSTDSGQLQSTVLTSAWTSDPLLGPCRDPFRDRRGSLDVQEVTDVGDDFQRVRGGEPMSVVDLRGEDAAVVGTVELQQGVAIG